MTASRGLQRRRMVAEAAGHASLGTGGDARRVLPIAGAGSLAFDADALRQRLGAWVATQCPGERANVEVLWRESTLVCDGIVALARATLGAGDAPLWLIDVTVSADARELAHWTGLPNRSLQQTVEVLVGAEVLDGGRQVGRERVVRVRPELLVDAPVLAVVDWNVVRARLGEADGLIPRLLVRDLARRTTPEARRQSHFISVSQRELADAIGYSKASMRRHLDALAASGVIVSRSRDRANSWHRLQPVVFGEREELAGRRPLDGGAPALATLPPHDDHDARDRWPIVRAGRPHARGEAPRTRDAAQSGPERRVVDTAPASAGRGAATAPPLNLATPPAPMATPRPVDAALTVEVNGVRVALPPGAELTLEQDASGALWYRAGALRLGPVRFA